MGPPLHGVQFKDGVKVEGQRIAAGSPITQPLILTQGHGLFSFFCLMNIKRDNREKLDALAEARDLQWTHSMTQPHDDQDQQTVGSTIHHPVIMPF